MIEKCPECGIEKTEENTGYENNQALNYVIIRK